MPANYVFEEDDSTAVEDEKVRQANERLANILVGLRKDYRNPELWVETATAFLALGDLENSLNCCRASLKVDEGQGEARLLMSKVQKLIRAQGVDKGVSRRDQAETQPLEGIGKQLEPESIRLEDVNLSLPTTRWLPEWGKPMFGSEGEALEQLREELTPSTAVICPVCNTLVGVEKKWCHGCGREMKEEVEPLERQVKSARARLRKNGEDRDALFTMGACFAIKGQHEEALEALNELGALDEEYPGLWWLKARVFQMMGKPMAASSARKIAMKLGTLLEEGTLKV